MLSWHLKLWDWWGVDETTLCDKVCQFDKSEEMSDCCLMPKLVIWQLYHDENNSHSMRWFPLCAGFV